jgi:outer membrane immunogenic protein
MGDHMKKILPVGAALAALLGGSAFAADMRPAPAYAPPPPAYNWTGGYWGVNVGYSWGDARFDSAFSSAAAGVPLANAAISERQNIDGVIGGVQGGYNYQSGIWVWGWETDIQASGQKGGSTFAGALGTGIGPIPFTATTDHKLEWFGTARTRLGFLWSPNVLVYATGGVAYGEVKDSAIINASTAGGAVRAQVVDTFKDVKAGWTLGAGIEGALGNGWSAKVEYLYIDLGETERTGSAVVLATGAGTVFVANANQTFRTTDNIVRAGLNYKFGSGGFFGTLFGGGGGY